MQCYLWHKGITDQVTQPACHYIQFTMLLVAALNRLHEVKTRPSFRNEWRINDATNFWNDRKKKNLKSENSLEKPSLCPLVVFSRYVSSITYTNVKISQVVIGPRLLPEQYLNNIVGMNQQYCCSSLSLDQQYCSSNIVLIEQACSLVTH